VIENEQRWLNLWWAAVAGWLGVIAFSSTSAAGEGSERAFWSLSSFLFRYVNPSHRLMVALHLVADKGVHVTMFAVLAILLWKAVPPRAWKAAAILFAGAFVGSGSEFLQSFYPDRDPAIRDVVINIGGTAVGLLICFAASRWHSRRREIARRSFEAEALSSKSVR
jgi:VanZ family protein